MSGLDNVMSVEAIEARWRANPLDTTFPEIPWWHQRRWCDCFADAEHGVYCPMTQTFSVTAQQTGFNPLELWPPDCWIFHLWMYCPDCERKYGEVNGSQTSHWCSATGEVAVT